MNYLILFLLCGMITPMTPQTPSKTMAEGDFDFQAIVRVNKQIGERMIDKCARRLYTGNRANSKQLPYQVTIRKEFDSGRQWWSVCGGAIITGQHVMTIAHCFADVTGTVKGLESLKSYKVIAGTTRSNILLYGSMRQREELLRELMTHLETWRSIAGFYNHKNYRTDIEDFNNLAVLKLTEPFTFTEFIKPIRMITDDTFHSTKLRPGSLCLVSGYGAYEMFTISTFLKMTCTPIVDFQFCKKTYYPNLISNTTQLCVGTTLQHLHVEHKMKKSTCTGDAGSPLVCQGLLVGIVSYLQGNCYNTPGIYTLISGYTLAPYNPFKLVSVQRSGFSVLQYSNAMFFISLLTILL